MPKQKINIGIALVLVWSIALAFATIIILKADKTDFSYLYSNDTGATVNSVGAGNR